MFKRRVLLATAALALTVAAFAQAASRHHLRQTDTLSLLSASRTYPNPGSTSLSAGTVTGTLAGRTGASVQRNVITGHPTATTYTFRGTGTAYFALGTVRSTVTGTALLQPDGSALLRGSGNYTGGSGRYRGARGTLSFTGRIPPAPTVPGAPAPTVVHVVGVLSY